jgi:hypothetical protein
MHICPQGGISAAVAGYDWSSGCETWLQLFVPSQINMCFQGPWEDTPPHVALQSLHGLVDQMYSSQAYVLHPFWFPIGSRPVQELFLLAFSTREQFAERDDVPPPQIDVQSLHVPYAH